MTNIKASRKGMRLNDAQYFRLPLPHTRKKMTIIRVIPHIVDASYSYVVQDSITSPNAGLETTSRCRGKTLESKQSSVEIALVTCNGFESINQIKEGRQDICIETEAIKISNNPSFLTWQEDSLLMVPNDSKKSFADFPQVEDDRRETIWNSEEFQSHVERNCKSVDRKQNCGDRVVELMEEEEKCNSWWKDSGQTILQFFAKILGKRGGIAAKGATGYVLPTGKQPRKRVKRVSRDGKGHNGCGRDVDGIRLKRVNNGYIGYIANHVYRDETSRYEDAVTENKSREKRQHHPSIFVRQIQRTRDKNLRVMLLERELRAHLPKAARRELRLAAKVRQLSSPLC
ncbi:hypothetical protein ALC56_08958 [Trachymyrmex septentrionalis]|uniref:Uncharacterized protein n=1 Tax=Trachymyrmex septentrionalis TaxID=34720 RepID=A0A195FAD0_9HYME|nr:PREDICTED: uncharacterized protein LOC108750784 [Trachymyrmex septentrionalis]KYN37167.1 hypothetical protein ALC56_08958 [Trachymyrmex septentrionalis]